jgi:hypothetical protein
MRGRDKALPGGYRSRKCTSLVAEELAVDQIRTDCAAVDCNEGPSASIAQMQGLRKQLLPYSALTGDQYRDSARGRRPGSWRPPRSGGAARDSKTKRSAV